VVSNFTDLGQTVVVAQIRDLAKRRKVKALLR
jgi:hypothetical protein